jgi:hypothetical protein
MNKKYDYIIGNVYNKLELINLYNKNNKQYAKTKCINCGKEKDLKAYELFNIKQNSCRCNIVKHGLNKSRIYAIYHNMKDRCYNPNCKAYKNYGARNIIIYKKWLNDDGFINFYNWAIINGYEENLTIDRKNVDGNYEPNNCRWITKSLNTALSNKDHPRR